MTDLPMGLVTFLFTDIEGSTRLLQVLGARYADLLRDHHGLMRDVLATHRGVEVSTEGDAFFVAFSSPTDAVGAAAEAQRRLSSYGSMKDVELRVRMGLHTGEGVILGDNYGGLDVHRGARIASAAHGGQVLLSDATRALAESSLDSSIRLKDLGEHHLKDLEKPERLYQLCIEGLQSEFPPPRSLLSHSNNLPVALTTFVARERELREIRRLLEGNRLITLTGPGGTGKTRLALEVASDALFDFDDGAFAALLSSVDDPDLIPSTIAEALALREHGLTPITEVVKGYLAGKSLLLILDNFEQVLPAAPFVADLLAAAPTIKILVTSRAALRISGEQEYPVPAMTLPDPQHLPRPEELPNYESVALFAQRARAVRPDFEISDQNAVVIAEICGRLDGLPLAIELAAARVKLLSPQEMLKKLDGGLGLLTGGARDLPARQQGLRAAIAWSYDLMDESLRRFFRRLAVFVGGWTLESADAVCNPDSELGVETFDALDALAASSLIRRFETEEGNTRFRMLQTIREYALELFAECDEVEIIRQRHATYFSDFVTEQEPKFTAAAAASRLVEAEHDNVRAVLRRALDRSEAEFGLRLCAAAWRFWMFEWHLAEGRRWLEDFLRLPAASEATVERARATMALGSITYWQNDFEVTARYYLEALEMFRAIGDRSGTVEALYNAGFVALINYDAAGARAYYEASRKLAFELSDERGLANTAWGLAMTALQERDWENARRLGSEAADRYEALGDRFGVSVSSFVFLQIARFTGDIEEAYRLLGQHLDLATDQQTRLSVLELLAWLESTQGRHEIALRLAAAGLRIREDYGGGSPPPLIDVGDPIPPARAALDEARFEAIWAEGWAMSTGEAITLVRKLLEA